MLVRCALPDDPRDEPDRTRITPPQVSEHLRGQPITEEAVNGAAGALCERARALWLEEDLYVDDITACVLVVQQAQQTNLQSSQSQQQTHAGGGIPGGGTPGSGPTGHGDAKRAGVPLDPAPAEKYPTPQKSGHQRNARMSVTALGPSGKRGAVSSESAGMGGQRRGSELRRTKKQAQQMDLILRAISDPRHLIFQVHAISTDLPFHGLR